MPINILAFLLYGYAPVVIKKKVFNNYYLAIKPAAIGKYISDFSLGSFDSRVCGRRNSGNPTRHKR